MGLRVLQPGLFSLLVDGGRPGWRELGVPAGGAFDSLAWRLGNALLGNPPNAVALEVTLAGPTLRAEAPVHGVLFGADFELWLNDLPWHAGLSFQMSVGDRLRIGSALFGTRAYLCILGGFHGPTLLGSGSALAPVRADELLACPATRGRPRRRLAKPWTFKPPSVVRLLPGSHLGEQNRQRLASETFAVAAEANRQGLRLHCNNPLSPWPEELESAPVVPGTLQLPSGGQPIVLGADAQTIGGYPRLGHVIAADQPALAQLRPGDPLRFQWVHEAEAQAALREQEARLSELLPWLRAATESAHEW